jgi:hypothetical protein
MGKGDKIMERQPEYPPEYDSDLLAGAKELNDEVERCLLEWETSPGPWGKIIRQQLAMNKELINLIEESL